MSNPTETPGLPEDVFGPAIPDPEGTARGRPAHRTRSSGSPAEGVAASPGSRSSRDDREHARTHRPTSAAGTDSVPILPTYDSSPLSVDIDRTSRLERFDLDTPAPLPPAPLSDALDGWFESVPTNPAPAADLAALAMNGNSFATGVGLDGASSDAQTTRGIVKQRPSDVVNVRPTWFLPALLSATSLAVGMVLGALVFGSRPAPSNAANAGDCTDSRNAATARVTRAAAAPLPTLNDERLSDKRTPANASCSLRVSSTPSGAVVTIDGQRAGHTPVAASDLPCGDAVEIEVRKPGWENARRRAKPGRDQTASVAVKMRRTPRSR